MSRLGTVRRKRFVRSSRSSEPGNVAAPVRRDQPRRELLRDAGWLLPAQYISSAFSLCFTLIAARSLGVVEYGSLAIANAFPTVIMQLTSVKASALFTRAMAKAAHGRDLHGFAAAVFASLTYDVVAAAASFVIVALTAPLIAMSLLKGSLAWPWLVMVAAGLVVYSPLGTAQAALVARQRASFSAALTILDGCLPVLTLLTIAMLVDLTAPAIVLSTTLAQMAIGAISVATLHVNRRVPGVPYSFAIRTLRKLPKDVVWNWLLVSCSGVATAGPLLLTGWLIGPAAAGAIRLVQSIANIALYIPATMARIAYARLAACDRAIRERLGHWTRRIGVPLSLLVALGAFGLPVTVPLVFGSSFGGAGWPASIVVLGVAVSTLLFWSVPYFYSQGRILELTKMEIVNASMALAGTALAAVTFGVMGVAIALSVTRIVHSLWASKSAFAWEGRKVKL